MSAITLDLAFDGALLSRGFWLYVWEITTPTHAILYYVGRTGDSSSSNAQSPFTRMGQHLGFNAKSNVLRRHLSGRGLDPESCSFRLVAHGPVLAEAKTKEEHVQRRDCVAAMEKALADAMSAAGYDVINRVNCRSTLDDRAFNSVRETFATAFPALKSLPLNASRLLKTGGSRG